MSSRKDWITMVFAAAGVGCCIAAVLHFLFIMYTNRLPWAPDQAARDHYLIVGQTYSQGFIVGFFLCFSLALVAITASKWFDQRRTARPSETARPAAVVDRHPLGSTR